MSTGEHGLRDVCDYILIKAKMHSARKSGILTEFGFTAFNMLIDALYPKYKDMVIE